MTHAIGETRCFACRAALRVLSHLVENERPWVRVCSVSCAERIDASTDPRSAAKRASRRTRDGWTFYNRRTA